MAEEIIFVGSSTEGKRYAQAVAAALRSEYPNLQQRCWWHRDVFRPTESFMESLEREANRVTAALFVFSPDDPSEVRKRPHRIPRDNVLFEYGMLVGLRGRSRVALLQVGDAKLPSDLSGMTVVRVPDNVGDDAVADIALADLRGWVDRLGSASASDPHPGLTQVLQTMRSALNDWEPTEARHFDRTAAQLLRRTYESVRSDNRGVNTAFARLAELELPDSVSISAYDTTGPAGWIGPATYRYLAHQVREYLFANRSDGRWQPYVHDWLRAALDNALTGAAQRMPKKQSLAPFDDSDFELPQVGIPKLQYSRVLVWTEEELEDPLAEPIINLHDAFRIPLFFVAAKESADERQLAFVVFEKRDGSCSALYGLKEYEYDTARDTSSIYGGWIPDHGNALDLYKEILRRRGLMLAVDARMLLTGSKRNADSKAATTEQRPHGA